MYKIYGKENCSSCLVAKELLNNKGYDFEYLTLGRDYNLSEFSSYSSSHRAFPLIVKDGQYFGGLRELREYLNKN